MEGCELGDARADERVSELEHLRLEVGHVGRVGSETRTLSRRALLREIEEMGAYLEGRHGVSNGGVFAATCHR
jgi:hypothetical protein